ncbi:MAG: hypothetical protein JNM94_01475 [Phycisphaerae bacterium]|nr:hypothetical protein [Phycisphaerae bacterium]
MLLYSLYGLSLGFALGLLVVLIPTSPHAAYRPPVGPGEDWPFVLEVAQVQLLVGSLCFALFGTVSWLLRKLEGPPA